MVVRRAKKSAKKKGRMHRLGLRRRGSGNRGGFGRAGSGKRAGHRAQKFIIEAKTKNKKGRLKSKKPKKMKTLNLSDLAYKSADSKGKTLELPGFKVLGRGKPPAKITVKARYFSKMAKEKIQKSGGKWVEI